MDVVVHHVALGNHVARVAARVTPVEGVVAALVAALVKPSLVVPVSPVSPVGSCSTTRVIKVLGERNMGQGERERGMAGEGYWQERRCLRKEHKGKRWQQGREGERENSCRTMRGAWRAEYEDRERVDDRECT